MPAPGPRLRTAVGLGQGPMGSRSVVVLGVGLESAIEVPPAEDERPVEALGPGGSRSPVLRRHSRSGPGQGCGSPAPLPSERLRRTVGLNFVSRARMRNRIAVERSSSSMARFRACWVTHAESGCAVDGLTEIRRLPSSMNTRDGEGAEPGGLDGAEVAGDDATRLRPEELRPGKPGPSRGGTRSGCPEQGADRRRADADSELAPLTLDAHAAPARFSLPRRRMSSRGPRHRSAFDLHHDPVLRYAHFLQTSSRCHRNRVAGVTGMRPSGPSASPDWPLRGGRGHVPGASAAGLPLEHSELVAQDEDLEVLGAVVSATLATANDDTDEGAEDEGEEKQHRPILPLC